MYGIGILRYERVKINIVKKFVQGDIRTPFFLFVTSRRWQTKKRRTAMVLYKITNKAPLTSMFWEPFIINDDQWLRKHEAHWRFIGEAVLYGIGFISNIGHDVVH